MTSASALMLPCAYPRAIKVREEGPDHDRVKCAKKKKRDGSIPGCATCGRHSPTCPINGVCVICSAPRGSLFHASVELWKKSELASVLAGLLDDEVRGWLELLAMQWAPTADMMLEQALGLSSTGGYVEVDEPTPHVYVPRAPLPRGVTLLTAGRADVVREHRLGDVKLVTVRDWKSGTYKAAPAPENLQVTSLALSAAAKAGADGFVREIYYTRDGYLDADPEPVMLDSDEAAEAWERVERAALLDEKPRPGPHCEPCWERRLKRCTYAQVAA